MQFFRPSTLISLGVAVLLVVGAFAITGDTVLAQSGLVPCVGTDCQACHIVSLIQNIINFLIGLAIPIAILLFAYAGVLLFTAGNDNPSRRQQAGKILRSALFGFIIALGSYLIIETFLHVLLDEEYFDGWNKVECVSDKARPQDKNIGDLLQEVFNGSSSGSQVPSSGGSAGGSSSGAGGTCANCTTIDSSIPGFNRPESCASQVNGACQVDPLMNTKLLQLKQNLGSDFSWYVSEAYPPTRTHQAACHAAGTCVDVSACNSNNGVTGAGSVSSCVSTFITAGSSSGIRAVYEVSTASERDAILDGGSRLGESDVIVVPGVAPHFSVYPK